MPVPEAEKTPAEILKDWASVGLSDEGTFKYVLIEIWRFFELICFRLRSNFNSRGVNSRELFWFFGHKI